MINNIIEQSLKIRAHHFFLNFLKVFICQRLHIKVIVKPILNPRTNCYFRIRVKLLNSHGHHMSTLHTEASSIQFSMTFLDSRELPRLQRLKFKVITVKKLNPHTEISLLPSCNQYAQSNFLLWQNVYKFQLSLINAY